jgi:NAD(P)-dependent dehydrogenase (short-subunit alcohol dehydrogenase family)
MNESVRLDGRVIVITGAGRGLGRAYAHLLSQRGAKVVVNDAGVATDGSAAGSPIADQVVEEIRAAGGQAIASTTSIASPEGGAALIGAALEAFGRLDGLVHNAGILRDKSLVKLEPDDVRSVLAVHLEAAFWLLKPAFAAMRSGGFGRVVLTTSSSGLFGNFGQSNYGAAKTGLVGLMRVLVQEGARFGILCNCVAPSARTRMTEALLGDLADKLDPAHVAPLVAYLCSERSRLNNQIFSAGGGRYARVFLGLTPGWVHRGSAPATPEDVEANLERILDPQGFTVPESGLDELQLMRAALLPEGR